MNEPVALPAVFDPAAVGSHEASAKAGGGLVWDEVLEYRVWFSPRRGAEDLADGDDYSRAFASVTEAVEVSHSLEGADEPIALVLQREYIDEPEPNRYVHVVEERRAEWPLEFLHRPRRDERTIPDFLAPDAPAHRLDIIRGLAPRPETE